MNEFQFKTAVDELSQELEIKILMFDGKGICINSSKDIKLDMKQVTIIKQEGFLGYNNAFFAVVSDISNEWIVGISSAIAGAEKILKVVTMTLEKGIKREDYTQSGLEMLFFNTVPVEKREYIINALNIRESTDYRVLIVKYEEKNIKILTDKARLIFHNCETISLDGNLLGIFIRNKKNIHQIIENYMEDIVKNEGMHIKIGAGVASKGSSGIHESFKTASNALLVGRALLRSSKIYYFEDLILPMLVYETGEGEVREYMKNTEDGIFEIFSDQELLDTGRNFLINNLNTSETANNMFVHRNTLVYRLNKIEKISGLDIRRFEDALKFYIRYIAWQLEK